MIDESPSGPQQQDSEGHSDQGKDRIIVGSGASTSEEKHAQGYTEAANSHRMDRTDSYGCITLKVLSSAGFWTAAATIVIAVATVVYTHYAGKQWQTMQNQYTEMQRATSATQDAANAARSAADIASSALAVSTANFQIEQRPYMIAHAPEFVEIPVSGETIRANITFENVGKTPAIKILREVDLIKFRPAPKSDPQGIKELVDFLEGAFRRLETTMTTISPQTRPYIGLVREDLAPGASTFSTGEAKEQLLPQEMAGLQNGAIGYYFLGIITYSDAYNGNYRTQFCYFYAGPNPKVWHICDSHETIE